MDENVTFMDENVTFLELWMKRSLYVSYAETQIQPDFKFYTLFKLCSGRPTGPSRNVNSALFDHIRARTVAVP